MIYVKELTKVYKSRKSGTCVALDRVSFTLPDKGFVFVVGKSGSGKTTLLSLLGGLDTITSGEIVVGGRHVEKFGLTEQVCYRNTTIGFIFQDFHLIDDLTISENIALALELREEEDKERIRKALKDTDLEAYGDRFPTELSGGQKQRVAIARALVKRPSVVLADEPTGNLDSKTTEQVLGLLKELSKEKLVLIVSHNLGDAERYADEIIELSDGKILRHVRRNPAFDDRLRVEGDTLVVPSGQAFESEDVEQVNRAMERGDVRRMRQVRERFLPCAETKFEGGMSEGSPIEKRHIGAGQRAVVALRFSRHGWLRTAIVSLVLAAILVVLGLSQLIMNFNGGEVITAEMQKRNLSCNTFIKDVNDTYESLDVSRIVDVEEGDLQAFYDAGYEGKAYPLVNYCMYLKTDNGAVSQKKASRKTDPYNIEGTTGVLVTDRSFVERKFGPLEYVALAETQQDYGIFLTDFFADAALICRPDKTKSYSDLLGAYAPYTAHRYGYVNGIIKTGYKERYGDILEKITDPNLSREELRRLLTSEEYLTFYDEIGQYLVIAYSFDPDFAEKSVTSRARQFVSSGISTFNDGKQTYEWKEKYFSAPDMRSDLPLGDNEIAMNYNVYNEIFGTNYTPNNLDRFEPQEVKFCYYTACDENTSQKKYEATLTIVKIRDQFAWCNVAENVFRDLQRIERFTLGYYFDNEGQAALLANVASGNGFIPNSVIGSSVTTMTKAVSVFSDFFVLIFVVLCVALLLMMVQFELKNIRDRMKEIGILKALGARNRDLVAIFGFQVLVAGIAMVVFYIVGSFVFIGFANGVLAFSLAELAGSTVVTDVAFLTVKWQYLLENCILALLIMLASFLVPMLRLRYIKPTNVIKAKE